MALNNSVELFEHMCTSTSTLTSELSVEETSGLAESSSSTVQVAVVTVALSPDFSLECPVLLNSRKLTISVLKAITRALYLPSKGTKEETVLMIEGNFAEYGQEPQNVQVNIVAREGSSKVVLI